MPRRRKTPVNPVPHIAPDLDWVVSDHIVVNGRHVEPGTELKISGERGRFRFQRHVARPDGREWVDVIGGPEGAPSFRSFRPERIRRVHRLTKTRANSKEKR